MQGNSIKENKIFFISFFLKRHEELLTEIDNYLTNRDS